MRSISMDRKKGITSNFREHHEQVLRHRSITLWLFFWHVLLQQCSLGCNGLSFRIESWKGPDNQDDSIFFSTVIWTNYPALNHSLWCLLVWMDQGRTCNFTWEVMLSVTLTISEMICHHIKNCAIIQHDNINSRKTNIKHQKKSLISGYYEYS